MSRAPDTFKGKRHDEDRKEEQSLATEEETPAQRQLDELECRERCPSHSTYNAMGLPAAPECDQAPPTGSSGGGEREAEPRSERQRRSNGNPSRHDREIHPLADAFRKHSIGYPLGAGVCAQRRWRAHQRKARRPRLVIARLAHRAGFPVVAVVPVSASPSCTSVGRSSRHAAPDEAERPVTSMPFTSTVGEG